MRVEGWGLRDRPRGTRRRSQAGALAPPEEGKDRVDAQEDALLHAPRIFLLLHRALQRLGIYCRATSVSAAHATHCAKYVTDCWTLIRRALHTKCFSSARYTCNAATLPGLPNLDRRPAAFDTKKSRIELMPRRMPSFTRHASFCSCAGPCTLTLSGLPNQSPQSRCQDCRICTRVHSHIIRTAEFEPESTGTLSGLPNLNRSPHSYYQAC